MITQEQMESALEYLVKTDREYAEMGTACESYQYLIKQAKATAYLRSDGTVDERKSVSEIDDEVKRLTQEYLETLEDYRVLDAHRKSASLKVSVWQSINRARSQGNV